MSLQKMICIITGIFVLFVGTASANSITFLTMSDIHLNHKQSNFMKIDPSGYDSSNDMDNQSFLKLSSLIKRNIGPSKLIPTPKFILYLGDMVGHQRFFDFNRRKLVKDNEKEVFLELQNMFPSTPIISVFGNNDSFEKNYGHFLFQGLSPYKVAMKVGFKNGFLSTGKECNSSELSVFPCILSQNNQYGFFSIKLEGTLMLIGLNSVMFSPNHTAIPQQIQVQMDYLEKQLTQAKEKGMSVLIAMHIPVGNNVYHGSAFWKQSYQETFLHIIRHYHKQIRGILVGHTHMEEFKVIKVPHGQDIGEYFTAGLSTSHGNSPSIKHFTIEENNKIWSIKNYTSYQIHENNNELLISKYYNFYDAYCREKSKEVDINSCLSEIKFHDILPRYTVNNPNYQNYKAQSPQSFYMN